MAGAEKIKSQEPCFPLRVFIVNRKKGRVELRAEYDNIDDLGLLLEFYDSDFRERHHDIFCLIVDALNRKIRVIVESLEVKLLEVTDEVIDLDRLLKYIKKADIKSSRQSILVQFWKWFKDLWIGKGKQDKTGSR